MSDIWFAIVLAGAGTFAMRASFVALAHRLSEVPPWLARILRQIPPAALSAIVLPAVVRPEGVLDLAQPRLAAGVIAALIAWRSRNVLITLGLGMMALVALEAIWP